MERSRQPTGWITTLSDSFIRPDPVSCVLPVNRKYAGSERRILLTGETSPVLCISEHLLGECYLPQTAPYWGRATDHTRAIGK
jgi:hypothetical protein